MSRLLPAAAIAVLLAGSAAVAQTTKPGDTAPNPPSPGAQAPATETTPPAAKPTEPGGTRLAPTPGTTASTTAPTLTEAEAKKWVDKAVYSSDNKNVGEVAAIQRDASGKVTEMHADIGGFLGLGTTRVKLEPSQFKLSGDRVQLDVTSEQVKQLPKVTK